MFAGLLSLIAAPLVAAGDQTATFDGECIYPPALGQPAPGETRILCDTVVADTNGIEFRLNSWDARMIRFSGTWRGEDLMVTSIQLRTGKCKVVRGQCRFYYAGGEVSMISCTSVAGADSWIANFRNPKI